MTCFVIFVILSAAYIICNGIGSAEALGSHYATWYKPGQGVGACGTSHSDTEYIAAVSYHFWKTPNSKDDPLCSRVARVTNTATGVSMVVRIRDKCEECERNRIDLSPAAFKQIQPGGLAVGLFQVKWEIL